MVLLVRIISGSENLSILFELPREAVFLSIGYPVVLLGGSLHSAIRLQRLRPLCTRWVDRVHVTILNIVVESIEEAIDLRSGLWNVVLVYLIVSLFILGLHTCSRRVSD